jgi:hypothetical protein
MTAAEPVRVLVVDDQRLIREGIASLLSVQPGIAVVGTAADGNEAVEQALALSPDVVLMDVRMPVSMAAWAALAARLACGRRVTVSTSRRRVSARGEEIGEFYRSWARTSARHCDGNPGTRGEQQRLHHIQYMEAQLAARARLPRPCAHEVGEAVAAAGVLVPGADRQATPLGVGSGANMRVADEAVWIGNENLDDYETFEITMMNQMRWLTEASGRGRGVIALLFQ